MKKTIKKQINLTRLDPKEQKKVKGGLVIKSACPNPKVDAMF